MIVTEKQLETLAEKAHLHGQHTIAIWLNFLAWGEFHTHYAPGGEHFDDISALLEAKQIKLVYRPSNGLSLCLPLSVERLMNDSEYFQAAKTACELEGLQGPATFFPSMDPYDTVSFSFQR